MVRATIPPLPAPPLASLAMQTPADEVGPGGVPLQSIARFREFRTRQEFRAVFGVEPPAFDPALPPQYWLDPRVEVQPGVAVAYNYSAVTVESGQGVRKEYTIADFQAAMVNIPGLPELPPLNRDHVSALRASVDGKPFETIKPDAIATLEEAEEILSDLIAEDDKQLAVPPWGGGWRIALAQDYFADQIIVQRPSGNTDPRDFYLIVNDMLRAFTRNVGKLWTANRAGRNFGRYYPGTWKFDAATGMISFFPETLHESNGQPEQPVPTRDLRDGERVVSGGPMGRGVVVKDASGEPGGAALQEVLLLVRDIHARLGSGGHQAFE